MNITQRSEGAGPWSVAAPSIETNNTYKSNITDKKKISNSEASLFLKSIVEDDEVTFQTFDDRKGERDQNLVRILHGTLEEHLLALTGLNERGAGIFFTVNSTDLEGRKTENITKVRALFVDLDGAPLEPVLSAPLRPHIVVESSPKRYHAYWLVEGIALEHFSLIQKALISMFNADPAVHDLPRVMRLPGFFHRKGDPFLVKAIESSAAAPVKKDFEPESSRKMKSHFFRANLPLAD